MRRRIAFTAALALLVAPSAEGHASSVPWTLAHARAYIATHEPDLLDRTQRDRPEFDVRISRANASQLVPLGPRHGRGWLVFHFAGRAHDVLRDADVHVRFTLRPSAAAGAVVSGARGPKPNPYQPRFPIRATFYYGWFPEAWNQDNIDPFSAFHPSLGFYDAGSPEVVRKQLAALRYGRFAAGIFSWWGEGSRTDARLPLALALARQTPFRWAVYYEPEGYADPTSAQIHDDLAYLARYFSQPAYLRVDGKPVVFAYGDGGDNCSVAQRWRDANAGIGAYLVLSAFGAREHLSYEPFAPGDDGVHVAAGDVDGDGRPELIAASGSDLRIFRRDGSDVAHVSIGAPIDSVAAGDLDGNGNAEVVTGSSRDGRIRVFDVVNGKVVERLAFDTGLAGTRVAAGNREIVVGAENGTGVVKVYSATGTQLSSFAASTAGPVSVAVSGSRIVTAAHGEVRVFAANGVDAYPSFFAYGDYRGDISVGVGDTNDDGSPDVVTDGDGVPVRIFSLLGPAAAQFAEFGAFDSSVRGVASVATADTNGNGAAEVLAGVPPGAGSEVRLLYGFRDCADQPNAWHVYNPAQPEVYLPPYEFGISPGFTRALVRPGDPSLPRDLSRWGENVTDLKASSLPWQLVETFNEWGEGTSIESAQEWATPSGYGAYLDALHAAP